MSSVEYTFDLDGPRLHLAGVRACLASARPSDDVQARPNMTGSWVEYADAAGRTIYRTDVYALLYAVAEGGFRRLDQFTVVMPDDDRATTIRVFAPPLDSSSRAQPFGAVSVLLGQFAVPDVAALAPVARVALPADLTGKGRGRVLRCTQIRDRGAVTDVLNLVILADKFGPDEQSKFIDRAYRCVNFLMNRPPFSSPVGYDSLNVWLVEVESTGSGTSYFDVHDGADGITSWSTEDVRTVCDTLFSSTDGYGGRYWHWAGVIANAQFRGTQQGPQFAIGDHDDDELARVFQHELGHAAFSLGDEYAEWDQTYTGAEPTAPNLTTDASRTNVKWGRLVEDATPVPTPDSFYGTNRAAVGFYEGGDRYARGVYRPHEVCVMKDHRASDVDGKFCSVCLDKATLLVSSSLSAFIPVPGVVQYSPVDGQWSNVTTSAPTEARFVPLDTYADFDALIDELRLGTIAGAGSRVRDVIMKTAKVPIQPDAAIIRTTEDGLSTRGLWYITDRPEGAVFYICTVRTRLDRRILVGSIKLPSIPRIGPFDGVTSGREQHLFYIDDGNVAKARLTEHGEFVTDFTTQHVTGLGANVEQLSCAFKSARIWLAVVDGGTVKLGYYSLISQAWDPAGFVPLTDATGSVLEEVFEEVKVTQIDPSVYVLARHTQGVTLAVFDPATMTWRGQRSVTVSEARDVEALDLASYQNTLWLTLIRPDHVDIVTYDLFRQQVVGTTRRPRDRPAVITSFGTTVLGKTAHWVGIVDGKAQHEKLDIAWDDSTGCFTMVPSDGPHEIDVLNETGADVAALATHNNGEKISALLSQQRPVGGAVGLWGRASR